jgi:hypothetical protein
MQKIVLIAALTIGVLMVPFLVYAEIYKWVDEKGTVHFTEDNSTIPEKYEQQVERIYLPQAPEPKTEQGKTEGKTAGTSLPGPAAQEVLLLFSGLISAVSDSGMSIALTAGGKEMAFTIFEDTSIKTDQGENVSFDKLRNGMSARVEYVKEGDNNRARSIKVSLLDAGATNAVEDNQAGIGQLQSPGKAQTDVWNSQKSHHTLPSGRPSGRSSGHK